jgi:GGDEF domain-containing protein
MMDGNHALPVVKEVVLGVWVLTLVALVVLWRQRPPTVLDVWLLVAGCAVRIVTVSIGASSAWSFQSSDLPASGDHGSAALTTLVNVADKALYVAKTSGRNQVGNFA